MAVAFRKFKAIYVQGIYGSIDHTRTEMYERSTIKLISYGGPAELWSSSKTAFSSDFVKNADERSSTDSFKTH